MTSSKKQPSTLVQFKKIPREDLNIAYKSYKDLVTQADFASEGYQIGLIQASFPVHGIFAEESGQSAGLKAHQWSLTPRTSFQHYSGRVKNFQDANPNIKPLISAFKAARHFHQEDVLQ